MNGQSTASLFAQERDKMLTIVQPQVDTGPVQVLSTSGVRTAFNSAVNNDVKPPANNQQLGMDAGSASNSLNNLSQSQGMQASRDGVGLLTASVGTAVTELFGSLIDKNNNGIPDDQEQDMQVAAAPVAPVPQYNAGTSPGGMG